MIFSCFQFELCLFLTFDFENLSLTNRYYNTAQTNNGLRLIFVARQIDKEEKTATIELYGSDIKGQDLFKDLPSAIL